MADSAWTGVPPFIGSGRASSGWLQAQEHLFGGPPGERLRGRHLTVANESIALLHPTCVPS
jgi:hypothetical protein